MRKYFFLTLICALGACTGHEAPEPVSFVNTRIGSGGHGHVFVGASVPFGMVQLGPTSIPEEWDWTSGYHASDSTVIGFSHTHLNGTGIGDLFDITVMPVTGPVTLSRGTEDQPQSGLWSYADRTRLLQRSAHPLRNCGRTHRHRPRGPAPLHLPGFRRGRHCL